MVNLETDMLGVVLMIFFYILYRFYYYIDVKNKNTLLILTPINKNEMWWKIFLMEVTSYPSYVIDLSYQNRLSNWVVTIGHRNIRTDEIHKNIVLGYAALGYFFTFGTLTFLINSHHFFTILI